MTKQNKAITFCLAFLLLLPTMGYSQGEEKQSLVALFKALEDQFEVQFNYAVSDVSTIQITPAPKFSSVDESLNYLDKNTVFTYALIGERIITVERVPSQICGYLIDVKTKSPLQGVVVRSGINGVVTNSNGFFKLTALEKTVEVKHLGYQTLLLNVEQFTSLNCPSFLLESQVYALGEVLLSSYIVRGIDKLDDGNFEIDFANFSILPGLVENDVLQSAQSLPGIQSINETVSNINIRGGSNDQNLILWDDIKMYQSGHFFGLISAFNPQITASVKVIKSGTDAQYTDGVSGSILMTTDTEHPDKLMANVGVNFVSADGFVDIPISSRSSIQVAARKSISDLGETPTYERYFDRISQTTEVDNNAEDIFNSDKQFDFYDASFRWLYNFSDNDALRVNFINVGNNLVFNENAIINGEPTSRRSSLAQNSIAGGIFYSHEWEDESNTSVHIYETDYTLRAINANIPAAQRFLQENIVSETGIRLQHQLKVGKQWKWQIGYHGVETEITNLDDVDNPLFRERISNVVRTHSLFSQMNYQSTSRKTHLKLGMRASYIDKFKKTLIEPRVSLSHKLSTHFNTLLSAELKHQNTSQIINFQNDFLGIEKRRWQLANDEDIPILQSKQFTGGFNYEREGWLLDVEGYYKEVDGITMRSQGFQTKYQFTKGIGSYQVLGVDFLARKQWDEWSLWLSYSTMDNSYSFPETEERTFRSNFDIRQTIKAGIAYRIRNLKVAAGVNWHTGKPTTALLNGQEVVDGNLAFGRANDAEFKDYIRVDLSALYQLSSKKGWRADLGVSVWNIVNQENVIDNFYRINEQQEAQEFVQRALGITTNAVIRVYL